MLAPRRAVRRVARRPQGRSAPVTADGLATDARSVEELPAAVRGVLRHQDGVVSRRQLLDLGHAPHDVRRWRRRRLLVPWHDGVYLDHTGRPTWSQRAWAAVLCLAPAALHGPSVLRAVSGPGLRGRDDAGLVHVAVDHGRTVSAPPGVRVHRVRGLAAKARWDLSPPRMCVEDAVLDAAASARDDFAAVAVVAAAVGGRLTTAARLAEALGQRRRIARRAFLRGVVEDVGRGECSVLEREYARRVERAHGLPAGRRQPPCCRRVAGRASPPGARTARRNDERVGPEPPGDSGPTRSGLGAQRSQAVTATRRP